MPKDIIHEDEYFLTQAFFFAQDVLITNILLYAYIKRDGSITSRKTHQQWLRSFNDFFETLKLTANLANTSAVGKDLLVSILDKLFLLISNIFANSS
jgi:hypothetical protein